jgi:hypothetical protein
MVGRERPYARLTKPVIGAEMQSLVVKISNPETVHAIAEAAKRQGTTPEAAALELLETAVLAQNPFEEIVEPIAGSFDESGMSEEDLDDLIKQTQKAIREDKRQNK